MKDFALFISNIRPRSKFIFVQCLVKWVLRHWGFHKCRKYINQNLTIWLFPVFPYRNGWTERSPTLTTWCSWTRLQAEHTTTWLSIQWYVPHSTHHCATVVIRWILIYQLTLCVFVSPVSLDFSWLHFRGAGPVWSSSVQGPVKASGCS